MHMGVDEDAKRTIGNLPDRGEDAIADLRELRIHHQDAIRPGEDADAPAFAFKSVKIVGDLGGLDFNLGEITLLGKAGSGSG